MPVADAEATQARLAQIGLAVDPGPRAAPMLDQAGRRMSARRVPPDDIALPPPPRSPELNPAETVRRLMRDDRPCDRIFEAARTSSTAAARRGASSPISRGAY